MKKFLFGLLLTGITLAAAPITANVKLVNAGNPAVVNGGYYIGPYTLDVNGKDIAALCVDFSHDSYVNESWNAYLTPLINGDFSNTYHANDSNVAQEYGEEAYLYHLITSSSISAADRINIQHAAWSITDSNFIANSAAQVWLTQAAQNYSSFNLSGYELVSSIDSHNRAQEFMIYSAPEPASFALLGGGLLVAGLAGVRKRRKATIF